MPLASPAQGIKTMTKFRLPLAAANLFALTATAHAQDTNLSAADTSLIFACTCLVLMMTVPGLALFYAGLVRKKNVLSTMMQSFAATCLVSLLWIFFGYSLAFTGDGNYIGSLDKAFMLGVTKESLVGTIPETLFMTFQMTFAILTPAVICGAFADRMKFSALLWFLGAWLLLVYVPVAHWVWGGGFLADMGFKDFAGGTVVEINSGIAGIVAAIMLGKRRGYPHEPMVPHNLVLSVTGASLLWVGWLAFNGGSALAANETAAYALANTQIAGAAGALAWLGIEWYRHAKPSVLGIISGAVAGLVAITPACGFVSPMGALVIGLLAGLACFFASTSLKRRLGYDDSLDVFGVHGIGGYVGTIGIGLFGSQAWGGVQGVFEGSSAQLGIQLLGCIIVTLWCAAVSWVILTLIDKSIGLRVNKETEIEGLDLNLHGEVVQ
jgi:ammonium transporter, Amt family